MDLNADALITIVQKRLCHKAAKETREVAKLIANAVLESNPEFFDVLREPCMYHYYDGYCHEMRPCGHGIAEVYR
jgi:thymidylate synthase ThyX